MTTTQFNRDFKAFDFSEEYDFFGWGRKESRPLTGNQLSQFPVALRIVDAWHRNDLRLLSLLQKRLVKRVSIRPSYDVLELVYVERFPNTNDKLKSIHRITIYSK